MNHNEHLANRIREALVDIPDVEEKAMFGGLCFMVDDKMCICTRETHIMCRVGPEEFEVAVEKNGASPMVLGNRTMKGYVYVEEGAISKKAEFEYWINASLAYNKIAKPSKKRSFKS